jgi:hypothetical protein
MVGAPRRHRDADQRDVPVAAGDGDGYRGGRRRESPRTEPPRPAIAESGIPAEHADERETDRLPIENNADGKIDYGRPRKMKLPATDQSYFTIPEVAPENEDTTAEGQPEDAQSAPLTWGRRRRASRGRR